MTYFGVVINYFFFSDIANSQSAHCERRSCRGNTTRRIVKNEPEDADLATKCAAPPVFLHDQHKVRYWLQEEVRGVVAEQYCTSVYSCQLSHEVQRLQQEGST